LGLFNSPPLAFATQLMRGSQSQAGSPLKQHHWETDTSGVVHQIAIYALWGGLDQRRDDESGALIRPGADRRSI
jgi:hypothetical protein